jgi:hypothetical protein
LPYVIGGEADPFGTVTGQSLASAIVTGAVGEGLVGGAAEVELGVGVGVVGPEVAADVAERPAGVDRDAGDPRSVGPPADVQPAKISAAASAAEQPRTTLLGAGLFTGRSCLPATGTVASRSPLLHLVREERSGSGQPDPSLQA